MLETYPYGIRKDLICKKEETECKNITKQRKNSLTLMMLQKKNIKLDNADWPQIPDHPYRILITGGSG